ncbi:putative Inactive Ribonuclease-Like Protein 12 [Manis pentadactyla]|nr:putative Inactive Ribonuclease-Like Protein 12 [Manis pentadactyla]
MFVLLLPCLTLEPLSLVAPGPLQLIPRILYELVSRVASRKQLASYQSLSESREPQRTASDPWSQGYVTCESYGKNERSACQNQSSTLCFRSETKFKMTVCQLIEGTRYPACRQFLLLAIGIRLGFSCVVLPLLLKEGQELQIGQSEDPTSLDSFL